MTRESTVTATKRMRLVTDLGEIDVELYGANAPITVRNFLTYVESELFNGGRFFRTVRPDNQHDKPVKINVVQAGIREDIGPTFPPIPLERTTITGLSHVDGTISMARGAPDSASSSFFVCVDAQPDLDFGGRRNPDGQGFAAFGKVIRGMDLVKRIWMMPASGEQLTPSIAIERAYVLPD